jgi:hypothetical protein
MVPLNVSVASFSTLMRPELTMGFTGEATWTQGLSDWIGAHTPAFAAIGGVPRLLVPHNATVAELQNSGSLLVGKASGFNEDFAGIHACLAQLRVRSYARPLSFALPSLLGEHRVGASTVLRNSLPCNRRNP